MPTVQETVLENNALQVIEEISAAPLALEDIWKGIEADQFVPYFQPKVNLRGMELAGVEALMRWQHPERGLLSAGAFLPLIQDNFLFDELTAIMLEKSIVQCRRWQGDRVNVPVSVNLSPCSSCYRLTDLAKSNDTDCLTRYLTS
jgi:EAL domain-containing protein (putative c-di-GMP-specific phosphodiesterase class I)